MITEQLGRGEVEYVQPRRGPARLQGLLREDPRRARLRDADDRVPDGIAEIVGALEEQRFGDPYDGRYRN